MLLLDELDRTRDVVGSHCFADMQVGEEDQTQTLLGLFPFGSQAVHDQRAIDDLRIAYVAMSDDHCPCKDSKCQDEGCDFDPLLHGWACPSVKV